VNTFFLYVPSVGKRGRKGSLSYSEAPFKACPLGAQIWAYPVDAKWRELSSGPGSGSGVCLFGNAVGRVRQVQVRTS
jgi:hypothetical protein